MSTPRPSIPRELGRVVMVVPTYDEADNLAWIIGRLREAEPDVHVLVVDDDSPDGTGKIADTATMGSIDTYGLLGAMSSRSAGSSISRAISTRARSPPESLPTGWFNWSPLNKNFEAYEAWRRDVAIERKR